MFDESDTEWKERQSADCMLSLSGAGKGFKGAHKIRKLLLDSLLFPC